MSIGSSHLPRRLAEGHAAESGAHCRERQHLDFAVAGDVVGVDRQQSCPGCCVDLVGALNAARHAHGRRVDQERHVQVVRVQDEGRADWLLAEELVEDVVLDAAHQLVTEVTYDGGVDADRHEAEGVASGHEAVVRLKVFKCSLY